MTSTSKHTPTWLERLNEEGQRPVRFPNLPYSRHSHWSDVDTDPGPVMDSILVTVNCLVDLGIDIVTDLGDDVAAASESVGLGDGQGSDGEEGGAHFVSRKKLKRMWVL